MGSIFGIPNPSSMDSNPMYLHHGDNPGSVLVTQLLPSDNYFTWSRSMYMALSAKKKLHFINGTLTKPSPSDGDFSSWTRYNDMVLSWIINSVSKEIAASVISVDSAKVMWNDLRDPFSQQNGPRIYQIQKVISAMLQEDQSVSSYFIALKGLWDELLIYRPLPICLCGKCSCGVLKTLADYHQMNLFHM